MKYFSTFSGIGGFEVGIELAHEINNIRPIQQKGGKRSREHNNTANQLSKWQCVGYSEIDKYAIQVYEKHFPEHKNYGDITKIKTKDLPDFELLVGGFPCQSFSIAGKRGGFNDTRGTLFFDIARILDAKRPRLLLLENVKGLLSHDGGRTARTIIATLDELGYDTQWQVCNSKNHGVPQNRERIYIVGHLRGTPRPEVFPLGASGEEHPHKANEQGCASTLTGRSAGGQNRKGNYIIHNTYGGIKEGIREFHDYSPTIRTARGGGHIPNVVQIPEATKKGYAEAEVGDSINLSVMNSKTRRGRVGKGVAQTLDTGMQQYTLTPESRIRRLTPIECERLQGFPDNWTAGHSDTQRYKMCGNAVTTTVVRDIKSKLLFTV